jgi:predicted RNase H-like HicB family nuclease
MKNYKYTVIFEPAEEGGYIVHVPALNSLTTEGDTLEEAKAMALDAIKGYLEVLMERGLPIPV